MKEQDDWLREPLIPGRRYHRVDFVTAELRDFGRDVGLVLRDIAERVWCPAMTRYECQKLFNDLWRFGFRPEGMNYCEGNHAPK